jgi:hypothetical protein
LAAVDRPFCHKNDILKQKRIAGSERVRRNLKYTKGERSARSVARSFERWGEREGRRYFYSNKVKYDQFFIYNLRTKLDLSHAFNSSSCVMNLPHMGGANLLVKSEGHLYTIQR